MTTNYLRARKYAGGSNVTTLVTLANGIRWLEQATLPLNELVEFLDSVPRLRNRRAIKEDFLERCVDRGLSEKDLCAVSRLVNVLINTESLSGNVGIALASWLAQHGIDASLHTPMSDEQWVVVFNPGVIIQHEVVSASKVSLAQYDLPRISI